MSVKDLMNRRRRLFGPVDLLFYREPLNLVRGDGVWLDDAEGRRYLDCYNNVPCVGHCHPRVVQALADQAAQLNTHTRYLDETLVAYGEHLLSTVPAELERLLITCTGSEANDVAMRIARVVSGGDGFICTNATYHGNTTAVEQLGSLYEPIGGRSSNIRMVPWPDSYRVPDGVDNVAEFYVGTVEAAIRSLEDAGVQLAGLILCPIFANEGLPDVPAGYLEAIADRVRNAGGIVIVDEVQAGFGRTGRWWGHQLSDMIPDVMTMGKPMGAGYPIAGVVARAELLDAFKRREMYFNTFAGNPVACRVAHEVLRIIEDEHLVDNAASMGVYLLDRFQSLMAKHELIGQVRGKGLFFGIDLVRDRSTREPASQAARTVVDRMRDAGVLMSRIGEHDNVLKIRPPLCFAQEHADYLLDALDQCLASVEIS